MLLQVLVLLRVQVLLQVLVQPLVQSCQCCLPCPCQLPLMGWCCQQQRCVQQPHTASLRSVWRLLVGRQQRLRLQLACCQAQRQQSMQLQQL